MKKIITLFLITSLVLSFLTLTSSAVGPTEAEYADENIESIIHFADGSRIII